MALGPGSIAFVGFNTDGDDNFAFVLLEDIAGGEAIRFIDDTWNGSTFSGTESELTWTVPTSGASAGTVIVIDNADNNPAAQANVGAVTATGPNFGLSATAETLYAITGTRAAPGTFIAAVSNDNFSASGLSGTGLVAGVNAVGFVGSPDGMEFTGIRTGAANFSDYLAIINNPANWATQPSDGTLLLPLDATAFTTAGDASPPTLSASTPSDNASSVAVADGEAFVKRGREDRHQFRLIVAPEDGAELGNLRDLTRSLMDRMEQDLETRLDWVAINHHSTGHPHTHVVVRGVTDDGKILNIAGDYIAHGIRARASEIVTLELGPQTEWEVQQKLGQEVEQDRFTRLDRTLLNEVNEQGVIDLRPGAEQSYLGRANRYLLIDRLKKLERMDLAHEVETGRWSLASDIEGRLRDLGERREIVAAMHRAFERQGVARSLEHYVVHREEVTTPVIGRVVGKGLAGDELTERKYLVIDGIDGRAHYVEIAEPDQLGGVRRGGIVEVGPPPTGPRTVDRTIAALARDNLGLYHPSEHLIEAQRSVRVPHDDYDGYVEAHVRRLEALRRAGIVERINADNWIIPEDFEQRAAGYDAKRSRSLSVRVLSAFDLEAQITSDGATWLDRQLVGRDRVQPAEGGFGREVIDAKHRRLQVLIEQGFAERGHDGCVRSRRDLLAALERQEVTRVGQALATERGLTFRPLTDGERIYGTFKEPLQLASGKYALIEHSHEFTLVPWRPVIERERGRAVAGLVRGNDISWEFGRKRSLGISM